MRRWVGTCASVAGFSAAVGLAACKSTAPPRQVKAIGIATDPQTASAQSLAGERAKKNLALLIEPNGVPFTYVSQGDSASVEAEREARPRSLRTQYRSLDENTWLAVARAERPPEVVAALARLPVREHDVTIRDDDLVAAYRRAEAALLRGLVEGTLGPRSRPTFATGQIVFVDLRSDLGQDWVRLTARAQVRIDQERLPTSRELARLRTR